jgi:hypothetical protein
VEVDAGPLDGRTALDHLADGSVVGHGRLLLCSWGQARCARHSTPKQCVERAPRPRSASAPPRISQHDNRDLSGREVGIMAHRESPSSISCDRLCDSPSP